MSKTFIGMIPFLLYRCFRVHVSLCVYPLTGINKWTNELANDCICDTCSLVHFLFAFVGVLAFFFACLLVCFAAVSLYIYIDSDSFSKCLNKMIEFLTRSIKRIPHYLLVSISLLALLIQANSTGYRTYSRRIGQAVDLQNLFDDVLYANNLYTKQRRIFFSIIRYEKKRDVIQ